MAKKHSQSSFFRKLLTAGAFLALFFFTLLLVLSFFPEFVDDTRYADLIQAAGTRHGVDPRLIRAVIYQESKFHSRARGNAGEIGLMQILPKGAVAEYCRIQRCPAFAEKELFKPAVNIEIGTWYLARALQRWGDYRDYQELALCQYNAGESRAKDWAPENPKGDVIPRIRIESTRNYVKKIMSRYRFYCGGPDA